MDDRKLNQLADDVHLITAPVRIVVGWIKGLLFVAILMILALVSLVKWVFTGESFLEPEEIWFVKVVFTILSPWIVTFAFLFLREWRLQRDKPTSRVPSFFVFVGTIALVLLFVKCNFYYGWGFYD